MFVGGSNEEDDVERIRNGNQIVHEIRHCRQNVENGTAGGRQNEMRSSTLAKQRLFEGGNVVKPHAVGVLSPWKHWENTVKTVYNEKGKKRQNGSDDGSELSHERCRRYMAGEPRSIMSFQTSVFSWYDILRCNRKRPVDFRLVK